MLPTLYGKTFYARLGRIFSNISIVSAIICAASMLASLLAILYTVVMVLFILAAVILTLFIILAYYPHIFDLVNADATNNVITFLLNSVAPPSAVVAAVAGATSLVFLFLGEPKKNVGRITFSAIVTVLGVVAVVAVFSVGVTK